MLAISHLLANQTDVNITVSNHLLGITVQSYMRASISRRKPIASMMLLRYTATVGDMAQCQKQRQGGTEGNFFPALQSTARSKGGHEKN